MGNNLSTSYLVSREEINHPAYRKVPVYLGIFSVFFGVFGQYLIISKYLLISTDTSHANK